MPTKRQVVEALHRNELLAIAERYELEVADKRVTTQLVEAAASSRKFVLADVLAEFARDRLKELCRELGLDDGGKEKQPLVERLARRDLAANAEVVHQRLDALERGLVSAKHKKASIDGWRGQPIAGVRSRGASQTFWARNWRDLVLDPTGDIVRKSGGAPGASRWFTTEDHAYVTEVDRKCSYLQSLQSEDTVTWAAFGPKHVPDAAIAAVLDLAFGTHPDRPRALTRRFWQRFEHPETRRLSEGPEPDLVLDSPGWRYVVEAKWLADLDDGQGVDGKTNQLAMRLAVARSEVNDTGKRGVLVIVPGPTLYRGHTTFAKYFAADGAVYRPLPPAQDNEARAVTWEQVIEAIERETGSTSEVVQYLRWRLANIPR